MKNKMLDILIDLKENYNTVGVKAEFAEAASFEELLCLKDMATKAGLELAVKIGGCESLKDLCEVKSIGADIIIAPMIESSYSMQKFIQSTKSIFNEEIRKKIKLFINIETICGFNNLDEILQSLYLKDVNGIVFGRSDMCGSLGISDESVNSDVIFGYAQTISEKIMKFNKELVIGGGVSAQSLPFFSRLSKNALTRFETRKIIFDAPNALCNENIDEGILKAIGFEMMWLKNKINSFGNLYSEDSKRIEVLESRYHCSIENLIGSVVI